MSKKSNSLGEAPKGQWEYYHRWRWIGLFWRWRYRAANGEKMARGEAYRSKQSCLKAIEHMRKIAPDAPVVEVKK